MWEPQEIPRSDLVVSALSKFTDVLEFEFFISGYASGVPDEDQRMFCHHLQSMEFDTNQLQTEVNLHQLSFFI